MSRIILSAVVCTAVPYLNTLSDNKRQDFKNFENKNSIFAPPYFIVITDNFRLIEAIK